MDERPSVDSSVEIQQIEFISEGAVLRGDLLKPKKVEGLLPAVVMAHGTSATTKMVLDRYADVFCRAGFVVLAFDHKNFGRSGGLPRQEINPWVQARGYQSAIEFVCRDVDVDPRRLALWGDSYTGLQVLVLAAVDSRVKAVVAQCPVCGERPPVQPSSRANFSSIVTTLGSGQVEGDYELVQGPMPVVSDDQSATASLLKPIEAFRWFLKYGEREGTLWSNRVTRVIPKTDIPFSAYICAPFIRSDVLMMVAPNDEMVHCNYQVARETFELIPAYKEWADVPGGHFGLLEYPSALFDQVSSKQVEWLQERLK